MADIIKQNAVISNNPFVWPLMLAVAVVGSNSLVLSPILRDVAVDLGASSVATARAGAAYGVATALSALCLGPFIDRVGAARALLAALPVLALALVGSAAANHWAVLAAAQGLAGLAAGVILPATYALATATAPRGGEAQALGRVLTGWSVSLVAGVPLSALVAGLVSWRLSYLAMMVLVALAIWPLWRLRALDSVRPRPAGRGVPTLVVLRLPGVPTLLTVCLFFMTAFYGAYAFLGDHARRTLGLSAGEAGLIVLAYGVGFGLAAFGDRMVDRLGAARLFAPVLATVALVYVGLIPATASYPALLGTAALWGCANHFGLNILVLLLSRASPAHRGAVLSLNSAVTYAGTFIGTSLFGAVYDARGYAFVAGCAAACAAVSAIVAWMGQPRTRDVALGPDDAATGPSLRRGSRFLARRPR